MKRTARSVLALALALLTALSALGWLDTPAGASMLPLKEQKAYLGLYDKTPEEIAAMPVGEMLGMLVDHNCEPIEIPDGVTTVWRVIKSDEDGIEEYHRYNVDTDGVITPDERMDLSAGAPVDSYLMELIIGDGRQLNPDNTRLHVKVFLSDEIEDSYAFELYEQDENGNRTQVIPQSVNVTKSVNGMGWEEINTRFRLDSFVKGTPYYLGITSAFAELPFMQTKVYQGMGYFSGRSITEEVLFRDMTQPDAGVRGTAFDSLDGIFIFEYTDIRNGTVTTKAVEFQLSQEQPVEAHLCTDADGALRPCAMPLDTKMLFDWEQYNGVSLSGKRTRLFMLEPGQRADAPYTFYMEIPDEPVEGQPNTVNRDVAKAVVGDYAALEDAQDAPDIKAQLTPTDLSGAYGYTANYDASQAGGGVTFKVFYQDGSTYTLTVGVIPYDPKLDPAYMRQFTEQPLIGTADPWFRVTGAKVNGKALDAYAVENGKPVNMDTYYGYGYQTVFVNDKNADLSKLQPTFWFGDAERVETYAVSRETGNKQTSGESVRDFASGAQQYATIIDDHVKNYQVAFVKKASGPKLYVCGPDRREVFLDEYFEYKHDILIANVGDQPLEGLRVKLDATHVKLDDYWTVGGTGNDTLAAFTTTEDASAYGLLPNLAKIRLLPDGEGDISGTLTISAKGQPDRVIRLSGKAESPGLLTEKLDAAVKWVPYSYVVATTNMYDWNEVTYEITSGSLPEGVELDPGTGEIYGVPQEYGAYTFTLRANFARFSPDEREYTLMVKDNTDPNVYYATDGGYEFKDDQTMGVDENGDLHFVLEDPNGDQLFVSNGEYGEFTKLWLNGELLEPDVDYYTESGSTRVTVRAQTVKMKSAKAGRNTIAAEFRKPVTTTTTNRAPVRPMRRTSQNYYTQPAATTPKAQGPFRDVMWGEYYFDPVVWAVRYTPQITNGTSATTFSPTADCTRAQTVTFLWRAMGRPTPKSTRSPFTDIRPADYYYNAVLWAVENGITQGTSATTFSPESACTRGQVVTFLWRCRGEPAVSGNNPFSDLEPGAYYGTAVQWAVSRGITKGTSATAFSPNQTCTRGQIVTFLYRDMNG